MLLRALRVTARRGAPAARRLSTPTAASPEAVCANIGVDHHEGALDQVFATLDQNGDGKIDPKELKTGLEAAGLELTDKALQRLTETYGDDTGSSSRRVYWRCSRPSATTSSTRSRKKRPSRGSPEPPKTSNPLRLLRRRPLRRGGGRGLLNADADGDGALNPASSGRGRRRETCRPKSCPTSARSIVGATASSSSSSSAASAGRSRRALREAPSPERRLY